MNSNKTKKNSPSANKTTKQKEFKNKNFSGKVRIEIRNFIDFVLDLG